jgi:hypothetical protein
MHIDITLFLLENLEIIYLKMRCLDLVAFELIQPLKVVLIYKIINLAKLTL